MTNEAVRLVSLSAAMDGSFTAIADVAGAMAASGTSNQHRLIGGVAVMLHIQRLQLDLPIRATADADFGVPPHILLNTDLVTTIEALGYDKIAGNRWERRIDDRRAATVDLLVPTYRSRARHTVRVGEVVTTEVPGLAEALQRPPIGVAVELELNDGSTLAATVALPDAVSMLTLKTMARTVRTEDRDVGDLWRCLEIAAAEGVTPSSFTSNEILHQVQQVLWSELGPNGRALSTLTADLQADRAARLRTRVRALITETVGTPRSTR